MKNLFKSKTFLFATLFIILSSTYWMLVASDRYVSTAHIVVESTDVSQNTSSAFPAALLTGGNASIGTQPKDLLIIRDYLLSIDIMRELDQELDLRAHYGNKDVDYISRYSSEQDAVEDLHEYYLSRVEVVLDEYSGVLVISAQAFDPEYAHQITHLLVTKGEQFVNEIVNTTAQAQLDFLSSQVELVRARLSKAREEILVYQNNQGVISPEHSIEGIVKLIQSLEAKRASIETKLNSVRSKVSATHKVVTELQIELAAVERQITLERHKLTSTSSTPLNKVQEEFQRMSTDAEHLEILYQSALHSLEQGRIDSIKTFKRVVTIQTAQLPESPTQPERMRNVLITLLYTYLLAAVGYLLAAIARDHLD